MQKVTSEVEAGRAARSDLFVSVVAPVWNASQWVQTYIEEMSALLERHFKDFEIVLVDDHSSDGTVAVIERLQRSCRNLQLYCLARRVGMDSAFVIGMEHAIGDVVITMDAARDPIGTVTQLIDRYYAGQEIVYGLRAGRDGGGGRTVYRRLSKLFFRVYRGVTGEDVPPDLSSLRLLSRRVVNTFTENRDRYNLFPVIAAFTGIPYATLSYAGMERSGAPRQVDYFDSASRAIYLLLLSSKRPLRWMTAGSLVGAILSLAYAAYVVVLHLFRGNELAEGWASLSMQVAGLFFVLFLVLAVMSEYLIRVFVHTQNRPPYLITRETSSLVLARKAELNVSSARGAGGDVAVLESGETS